VAFSAAILLAGALAYTTFAGGRPAEKPSELLAGATAGRAYSLTGIVESGTLRHHGDALDFRVRDRGGRASVPVRYTGAVPEPFREGREIVLTVRPRRALFVGEPGSLVTKCPSKFSPRKGT
jgi:cytochrome c-type biogenesis protein CcmE